LGPDEEALSWPLPGRKYAGTFKGPYGSGTVIEGAIADEIDKYFKTKVEFRHPPFDLNAAIAGEPEQVLRDIQKRQGQAEFRARLLEAYGNRCALSECDIADALEAAHILPYLGVAANHVQNGLLLRADLHTLFDLNLFRIDPECLKVSISPKLRKTHYEWLNEKRLHSVLDHHRPSRDALRLRAEMAGPGIW